MKIIRFNIIALAIVATVYGLTQLAFGAELYRATINSPDGGSFCSGPLRTKVQYAVQPDGGMYVRVCKADAGTGCTATKLDVHVDNGALYDIPMPGQYDDICAVPDQNTPCSLDIYIVDPPQLKVGP